jgi:hypothetical protein
LLRRPVAAANGLAGDIGDEITRDLGPDQPIHELPPNQLDQHQPGNERGYLQRRIEIAARRRTALSSGCSDALGSNADMIVSPFFLKIIE